MRKYVILLSLIAVLLQPLSGQELNTLTKKEQKEGWQLLFDGKSTAGWHDFNKRTIGSAWKVKDGILYLDISDPSRADILTDKEYENFELMVEWKVDSCGNSGIIFNAVESLKYKDAWNTGPEMQILDNECHPDGKIIKHRAGNLYDLMVSQKESVKRHDWNQVKIISNRGSLQFWLNDVKQVETTMFTPEWEAMIAGSKFKNHPDFGKARKGRIMLQEHDSKVWFRNIKIREL